MNDIIRFFIGVLVAILTLVIIVAGLVVLWPIAVGGALIVGILMAIIFLFFFIVGAVAFVWHMSRKEKPKGNKKNYSIKKGKQV